MNFLVLLEIHLNKQLLTEIFNYFQIKVLKKKLRSIGYMAHNNEKEDKHRPNKKNAKFCEITVSQNKKHKLFSIIR